MADLDDTFAQYSMEAVRASAGPLRIEPPMLAKRLHVGEVLRLLNSALPLVSSQGLRHRTEDLLSYVTAGQFPSFAPGAV